MRLTKEEAKLQLEYMKQVLPILKEKGPIEMENPSGGPPIRLTYEGTKKMLEDIEIIINENESLLNRRKAADRLNMGVEDRWND